MQKYIPVVVIKELGETDKILTALKNNGIYCAEITFRTACAAEAIAYAVKNYPDMEIGAGTVINAAQCEAALDLGLTTVKFFPANVYGGLKALKALSAPFPQVKFIPTGGVDRSNIDEFLAFDKIAAIGGSFFVKEALDKMEAAE